MSIRNTIKRILREEKTPTETEPLYWTLPYDLIKELGFEKYGSDSIYVLEIHFDTNNVLFEIYYDDNIDPDYISIPINELPKNVLYFILRRMGDYLKYI